MGCTNRVQVLFVPEFELEERLKRLKPDCHRNQVSNLKIHADLAYSVFPILVAAIIVATELIKVMVYIVSTADVGGKPTFMLVI